MKKKQKEPSRPKRRIWRKFTVAFLLFFIAVSATAAVYMVLLSHKIDQRFAGRLWDFPSKVYSDTTLLYTGERINRSLLVEKLGRLGYREAGHIPGRQGEMQTSARVINIYLHDFQSPTFNQQSKRVRIDLRDNQVEDITNLDTGKTISLLELEPEELMLYYGPNRERRRLLSARKLPPYVIHAVLAAEDHAFYQHHGFVIKGVLRAIVANLRAGGIRQGGSTITQQLAKNFFLTPERTYSRKLKELLISVLLEFKFSKTDILEIYLNEIYWGQRGSVAIGGMAEAARFYFDKEASELTVAEAATLAAMIRAPNLYSPYKNPDACLKRRNTVLTSMFQEGWLTEDELKTALATPLKPAPYTPKDRQAPYFMDYLTAQLMELYSKETLTTEGLSIYTTIDTQVQAAAKDALDRGLTRIETLYPALKRSDPEKQLQGAVVVMQPKTGYVLAMVGGRDYGASQYNRATDAMRQPGSAFKPFVYLSALDSLTPISKLSNTPRTFMIDGKPWPVKNFEEDAPEELTLRDALAKSENIATVNLAFADSFGSSPNIADVNLATAPGLKRVVDISKAFHLYPSGPFYPSMVLGSREITPLTLARAYCTFAADGVLPFPLSIKDVVDKSGGVLESRHARIERLISPAKAYMMSDLMRSVVEIGTARSLSYLGVDWPVAGKTGTTNDSRDAWFVGYTPDILALVWVGFDDGENIDHATGARAALPIWADLMKSLPQYVSGEWFVKPPGIETRTICKDSGMLANKCCPNTTEEIFLTGTAPTKTCTMHVCSSPILNFLEGVKKIVPGF